MAVDKEVITVETCEFDGDWEKATAIDVALTYAITAVDEYILKTKSEVRGRTPINATFDFTLTTTIFQAVLTQKGYLVFDAEDLGKLNDGAIKLLKKVEVNKTRIEHLEGIIDDKDSDLDSRDEEIRSLREQLAALQPQSDAPDQFKASECAGEFPYNPSNGMPCILKSSDPGHPGSLHKSEGEGQWWDQHGVDEAAARVLQHEQPAEPDFKASECDRRNPYRPITGSPCVIAGKAHSAGRHIDEEGVLWFTEDGINEAAARQQQAKAQRTANGPLAT